MAGRASRLDYPRIAICVGWGLAFASGYVALAYIATRLGFISDSRITYSIVGIGGFLFGVFIFGIMNMSTLCAREEEKDETYRR